MMRRLICLCLALPCLAAAADLSDIAWLEGEWQGYSGMGERTNLNHKTFAFEQAGKYLVERTISMFPVEGEPTVEYETHQDMAVFYAIGGALRAKSFFVEGFVQSSTVTVEEDGARVVIESTEVEGGPPGMRARLIYRRAADDRMTGTFELDWSGEGYAPAGRFEFKRVR